MRGHSKIILCVSLWLIACSKDEHAPFVDLAPNDQRDGGGARPGDQTGETDAALKDAGKTAESPRDDVLFDVEVGETDGFMSSVSPRRARRGILSALTGKTVAGFPVPSQVQGIRPSDNKLLYIHSGMLFEFTIDGIVKSVKDFPAKGGDFGDPQWSPEKNDKVVDTDCPPTVLWIDPETSGLVYQCTPLPKTSDDHGCQMDGCEYHDQSGNMFTLPKNYQVLHLGKGGHMLLAYADYSLDSVLGMDFHYAVRDAEGKITDVEPIPVVGTPGVGIRATDEGFAVPGGAAIRTEVDLVTIAFDGTYEIIKGPQFPSGAGGSFCAVNGDMEIICAGASTLLKLTTDPREISTIEIETPLWNVWGTVTTP